MKKENLQKMITVSKMYYEQGLNQEEIARRMNTSVAQVSRVISSAKREGYIKISVIDPFEEGSDLRKRMLSSFRLKDVQIVESRAEDLRITEKNVAQAAADYLLQIVQVNDIVGMAFSAIISKIPSLLPNRHIENVSFVQLNGAVSEHVQGFQYDTIRQTAAKLDAFYYYFPAPAIVNNRYVKDALHQDESIQWVIHMAEKANIALYSIGALSDSSVYVSSGFFSHNDMVKIKESGAVGEIYGHFLNRFGEINSPELDAHVLGMDITELRKKDYSVCVAAGEHLAEGVFAALQGAYCNVLVTDACTAKRLLALKEYSQAPGGEAAQPVPPHEPPYSYRPLADSQPGINQLRQEKGEKPE